MLKRFQGYGKGGRAQQVHISCLTLVSTLLSSVKEGKVLRIGQEMLEGVHRIKGILRISPLTLYSSDG